MQTYIFSVHISYVVRSVAGLVMQASGVDLDIVEECRTSLHGQVLAFSTPAWDCGSGW